MPTPSIQTLVTDAQQVLNLDSISAVRSVVAVALANANTGTPLNPNLTTQQLWNEFYQVVTKPKSDIESIIANQLMKFLFAPPAPGGVGANKQVIFNDGGVLAGDAGFTYDKATDILTLTSPAGSSVRLRLLQTATADWEIKNVGTSGNLALSQSGSNHVIVTGNGNIGAGVTPSAWGSGFKALEFANASFFVNALVAGNPNVAANFFYNASVQPIYKSNGFASAYSQYNGVHSWVSASSGTAGTQITEFATPKMTLDLAGNLAPIGNFVAANGKGIDFSATADGPSLTSELLNDYEEGTFTPTIIGTTTAGAGTYSNQIGRYTKIGRIVTAQIFVNWSAHTGTGDMRLSGLPFLSNPTAGVFSGAAIGWVNNITLNAGYILTGYVLENSVLINLQQTPTGGGGTLTVPIDTSGGIILTVTYSV